MFGRKFHQNVYTQGSNQEERVFLDRVGSARQGSGKYSTGGGTNSLPSTSATSRAGGVLKMVSSELRASDMNLLGLSKRFASE